MPCSSATSLSWARHSPAWGSWPPAWWRCFALWQGATSGAGARRCSCSVTGSSGDWHFLLLLARDCSVSATSSWMAYQRRGSYPALPLAVPLTQDSSLLARPCDSSLPPPFHPPPVPTPPLQGPLHPP